ncbi:porin family protein [Neisseria montereyensis]|uniref:Porin family protein n=1 Tax=Neisseria montereyensis TaxID=2973938 RepID=A0ABT2FEK1_9NEIS|nr:porin family protein [Neisseria montereyensis]MCS4534550.1 porin family protein [Neisseria montereyensis]
MKKILLAVLIAGSAAAVSAQSMSSFTGTGVEVGVGVSKTDFKHSNLDEKNRADFAIRGSQNVELGNNWIGGGEIALKPVHRTVGTAGPIKIKQKYDVGLSYVHGYRFPQDLMAYGKLGYHYGRFDGTSNGSRGMHGFGYGLGMKYAVAPNVEAGVEWEQTRYKRHHDKATNNSYMATVGYRF